MSRTAVFYTDNSESEEIARISIHKTTGGLPKAGGGRRTLCLHFRTGQSVPHPEDMDRLLELLKAGKKMFVVFDDLTRKDIIRNNKVFVLVGDGRGGPVEGSNQTLEVKTSNP